MKIKETKYLNIVNSVTDLRRLSLDELPLYCAELRYFIIQSVACNPGHLGSSLGAVEIAVALHYVYDTPEDRVVWDVGHQAYAHKIITGRKDIFHTNRKLGGISGFPKPQESEFDSFGAGHASVSISAAVGMAVANKLNGSNNKVVAVIGDGALTGGLAYEGLNNALNNDILVILNDNNISIDKNVGAMREYLSVLTTSKIYNKAKNSLWRFWSFAPPVRRFFQKIFSGAKSFFLHRSNLFEAIGFRYFGPIDGNDVKMLVRRFRDLKSIDGPKLLHTITVKGKGYPVAEANQTQWHAPGKFDVLTGKIAAKSESLRYQDIFGHTLLELAKQNEKIVGITPAMPTGSSLNILMDAMPERGFDVGIAEGHAVTFSAGLASLGMTPFCNIYSSFAQRSIDNIIHDVAIQELEVVLCLDRAGLVGEDGATHHGLFDIALLRPIPNVIIAAPSSASELRDTMYLASRGGYKGCFVIRYPRGGSFNKEVLEEKFQLTKIGESRWLRDGAAEGERVAILSFGSTLKIASDAAQELGASHIDLRYAKPLDTEMLDRVAEQHSVIVVVEDGMRSGGVGSAVLEYYANKEVQIKIISIAIEDKFIQHGTVAQLWELSGLTSQNIVNKVRELAENKIHPI